MKPLLERVEAEIAADRPWRAKEIIRGNMAAGWPDAVVVERYGRLLLELGERMEAGKFLFLSGVRAPEYQPAIDLFLTRYGRNAPGNMAAQFPRSFRRIPFVNLPEHLRADLERVGIREGSYQRLHEPVAATPSGWRGVLRGFIALALVIIFGAGIVVFFGMVYFWIRDSFG